MLALLLAASQAALLICNRIKRETFSTRAPRWRFPKHFIQKMADYTLVQLSYRRRTMSYSCQAAVTSNHRSGRVGCRWQSGGNLRLSSNQSTRAVRGFLEVRCRCHSQELSFYTPIFDHFASNYDGTVKLLLGCTLTSFPVRCLSNLNQSQNTITPFLITLVSPVLMHLAGLGIHLHWN